jgi:hypothetical protein
MGHCKPPLLNLAAYRFKKHMIIILEEQELFCTYQKKAVNRNRYQLEQFMCHIVAIVTTAMLSA